MKNKDEQYSNLRYLIGIICGQLKSANYTKFIAKQYNIDSKEIIEVDYRKKDPSSLASGYRYAITHMKDNYRRETQTIKASSIYGNDWGMGMFKYKACDVCDDVFNETADVVFGDAWIPKYLHDWKGTNIVITKNRDIENILQNETNKKNINLEILTISDLLLSQRANIKHRKELIHYRLNVFKAMNRWVPKKREYCSTVNHENIIYKIQNLRLKITRKSHLYFYQSQNILLFKLRMYPHYIRYKYFYYGFQFKMFLPEKVIGWLRLLKRIMEKIDRKHGL